VTYGPAIGKFHGIWPIMVPCNRDEFVFQENFKWVNIYDQLDPVAGPLLGYTTQFFGPWAGNGQTPKDTDLVQIAPGGKKWSAAKIAPKANISYSAGKVWLLAHLGYLTHPSAAYKQAGYAVFSLAKWLRTGIFPANEFEALDVGAWGGLWRWLVAQLQLIGIAIAVWLLAARIAWKAADKYALPYVHFDWIYCAFAAFIAAFSINYLIECFARIPPPPRMERVLYVTAAAFAGWHLDTALKVFPALMPAIAGGVIAGYLASLGLDFLSLRSLRWRIPSNRRRWVIAWGFAILSALVGCILYFSFGSWLVRQMTAVRGHFEHHSLQLFSLDVLSLTIVLIVLLGVCRWLFQPIPVRS
jgi:hypothetical protein